MATRLLIGDVRLLAKFLIGGVRLYTDSEDSYITIIGPPFDYVPLGGDFTAPEAEAIYEGADVSGSVVVTGTVDTDTVGTYVLTYTVPGTTPLLYLDYIVIVYDPSQIDAGEAGNIYSLIDSAVIEPVLATVN